MIRRGPVARALAVGSVLTLAACGAEAGEVPRPGADGTVAATPRALAAVVVEHVDPGEARRATGEWSDRGDPTALEAQVDYGVDPEGSENGETRTVRVDVAEVAAFRGEDLQWLRCRPAAEDQRCEERTVADGRLLYRWWPGTEDEEAGSYAWMLVRDHEVVRVSYEGTDLFEEDPRRLDLAVEPGDLRAAALDPAMSLRTTPEAWEDGAALDHYEGDEEPPEEPLVAATTPRQLADRVAVYLGREPATVRRSTLDDFGPEAVGAHLEYPASRRRAAFTIDVLTTVGRVPQLDPLPCRVQDSAGAAANACFAWSRDSVATWTLTSGDRPGALWIIGVQQDDAFNRVESVGIRVTSAAIDRPFFIEPPVPEGLPPMLLGDLEPLTGDLLVGPEQHRTAG